MIQDYANQLVWNVVVTQRLTGHSRLALTIGEQQVPMFDSGMQPWPSADNDLVQTHSAVTVQDYDAAFAFRFQLIDGDHALAERDD